jgi:hypothetical protein
MSQYNEYLKRSLLHAKECIKSIRRARKAAGDDPNDLDNEPPSGEAEGGYGPEPDPLLPPDSVRSRYLLH